MVWRSGSHGPKNRLNPTAAWYESMTKITEVSNRSIYLRMDLSSRDSIGLDSSESGWLNAFSFYGWLARLIAEWMSLEDGRACMSFSSFRHVS